MIRRQQRLRREYLIRKSQEEQKRAITEKKQRLKDALQQRKKIPTDLKNDALSLQNTLEWDDPASELVTSHEDDEYRWAGVEDPKVVITTSRDPSSRLKMFAKEFKLIIPNSQRINRGNYHMKQLIQTCKANNVTDFIIIHETRGNPDGLVISHLPFGPTAYFQILNTVMRHDIPDVGTMSEQYPHLIFDNFSGKIGRRVQNILRYLFPVPKDDSKRVMTLANQNDYISFRHHVYKMIDGRVELAEVGPRFELRLYEIKLGTIDIENAIDTEWAYRPYMNTAKKRQFLSEKSNDDSDNDEGND
ncbi:U3 small nucleolar ribonucleoprotein IMP4 [Dermatophagoides farinae]|uniref:U3 small nucleolar ribonucleoprotein imp4-like protein n=1 Tax=Dermatophagoides farinae TaxID=6954 RepID=A0A9D4NVI0_DERFA|nr:U3 small nucleolar ribonucleoprotein protein IMP4-like [Dermatophagoides farinae]KAH7639806.1 u3 small nucleolar ribonucleoprotein imp4-like protein [Dermatophagoides farinae]